MFFKLPKRILGILKTANGGVFGTVPETVKISAENVWAKDTGAIDSLVRLSATDGRMITYIDLPNELIPDKDKLLADEPGDGVKGVISARNLKAAFRGVTAGGVVQAKMSAKGIALSNGDSVLRVSTDAEVGFPVAAKRIYQESTEGVIFKVRIGIPILEAIVDAGKVVPVTPDNSYVCFEFRDHDRSFHFSRKDESAHVHGCAMPCAFNRPNTVPENRLATGAAELHRLTKQYLADPSKLNREALDAFITKLDG